MRGIAREKNHLAPLVEGGLALVGFEPLAVESVAEAHDEHRVDALDEAERLAAEQPVAAAAAHRVDLVLLQAALLVDTIRPRELLDHENERKEIQLSSKRGARRGWPCASPARPRPRQDGP